MPRPDSVASSSRVGQRQVGDRGCPGLLLGLGGRDGRSRGGRAAAARGGVVPGQLGVDLRVAGPPGGHEAAQERPAQVGVDDQPWDGPRAVEQAGEEVELLGGRRHADRGPRVGELVVAARGCGEQRRADALRPVAAGTPRGARGPRTARSPCGPGAGPSGPRRCRSRRAARTGPAPGSRRRTISASRVMSQAAPQTSARGIGSSRSPRWAIAVAERALVEADLGEREVVVVEQQEVRARPPGQLRAPRCGRPPRRARSARCASGGRRRGRRARRGGDGCAASAPAPAASAAAPGRWPRSRTCRRSA